ncbi:hypothetical protein IHV09_14275 [Fictibacillus sp. 23RED33]|uniref:hypothetical protein n=1 Tax=Fictibacillus sp. 23RED33 TaxID=2745879 RepID=UPI0018CFE474|nr:hypothetical protein [Fictibacillus sp. 23RED33]MBH0174731.1 hypothetical protein [Fictibacillus sp. 23RED33]
MDYKYENVENVEVKEDFDVWKYDDDGEVIEHLVIKKGTCGTIESMGCSSTDGFRPNYDIVFQTDIDETVEVTMYEPTMEEVLILGS